MDPKEFVKKLSFNLYQDDRDEFRELFIGRKIVKAEDGIFHLDNGAVLEIELLRIGVEGGNMFDIDQMSTFDDIITNVEFYWGFDDDNRQISTVTAHSSDAQKEIIKVSSSSFAYHCMGYRVLVYKVGKCQENQ
jgi:hypothetical protein